MGCGIPEASPWIQLLNGPLRLGRIVYTLRLINNHNRIRCLNKLDGTPAGHGVAFLMDNVGCITFITKECLNINHHDLDLIACRKLSDLAQLFGVINEIIKGNVVEYTCKMILRDLNALQYTLPDGNARNHDNKLLEPVFRVQVKDCPQVHIGLARAGLHFNREIRELIGLLASGGIIQKARGLRNVVGLLNDLRV